MKKFAGYIIILQMCTKYHNHMMYGSWDMEWERQKILSFRTISCPFTTPTHHTLLIPKIKCLEILSFYTYMCTINEDHMIYGSWNKRCDRQTFLSFWAIFCPFSLLKTLKIKTLKKWKKNLEILSFYTCVP